MELIGTKGFSGESIQKFGDRVVAAEQSFLTQEANRKKLDSSETTALISQRLLRFRETLHYIPQKELDPALAEWIASSIHALVERNSVVFITSGTKPEHDVGVILQMATNRFAQLTQQGASQMLSKRQDIYDSVDSYRVDLKRYIGSIFRDVPTLKITFDRAKTNALATAARRIASEMPPVSRKLYILAVTNKADQAKLSSTFVSSLSDEIESSFANTRRGLGNVLSPIYAAPSGEQPVILPFPKAKPQVVRGLADAFRITGNPSVIEIEYEAFIQRIRDLVGQNWASGPPHVLSLAPTLVELPNDSERWVPF